MECKRIYKLISVHYNVISKISDAIYNYDRYAFKSTFVLIKFVPESLIVYYSIRKKIRQTDSFIKIDDEFVLIEYPFIDLKTVENGLNKLMRLILTNNVTYKYSIMSIDENGLNTKDIIKKLVDKICIQD